LSHDAHFSALQSAFFVHSAFFSHVAHFSALHFLSHAEHFSAGQFAFLPHSAFLQQSDFFAHSALSVQAAHFCSLHFAAASSQQAFLQPVSAHCSAQHASLQFWELLLQAHDAATIMVTAIKSTR
jgi:hypothetical protein